MANSLCVSKRWRECQVCARLTDEGHQAMLSAGFPKKQALWGGPLSSPDGEVGVHHIDQFIEGALVGKRLPAVAIVE